jgi:MFS transporter, DHA2 family, multidrug resistance protein
MTTFTRPPRLQGLPLALATLAVASASFMNTLDTTIAIVALPTISGNLSATPSQGSWVITTYGVCLAVILPLSGWITRRFGEVNTFTASVLLFTVASWLCGVSTSFNQLLLFRALQGFAGGLLLPLSQSLLMRLYPPEKHGLALGIWAVTTIAAPVVGPVLGGYITDGWGWPWIFYINIPIGVVCVYLSWSLLRPFESVIQRVPVDTIGLVLLVVGVICIQLVLDRGHELDWLSSKWITTMLVISILCFFLFLAWERDEAHPVVDLSLFGYRNFLFGTALNAILYMTFLVSTVIYPIWLQTSMGYTASWSGLMMAPTGLGPLILMPLIGHRLRQWDTRWVITFGVVILTLALYLHAQSSTQSPPWFFLSVRLFTGLAVPFAMMPLMVTTLVGLPADKLASATGIFNFVRMLSASLGTAAGVTLWDQRSIFHRSRLIEGLSADSTEYQQTLDLLLSRVTEHPSALAAIDHAVIIQARTLAMDDLNYLCAAAVLSVAVFAWILPAHASVDEAAK